MQETLHSAVHWGFVSMEALWWEGKAQAWEAYFCETISSAGWAMMKDTFENGVGFDVPPAPYVTSQTQNTFWIHPFYLLSKCQH